MLRRSTCFSTRLLAAAALLGLLCGTAAAGNKRSLPAKNLKFDPSAEQVDLFEGLDAGDLSARLIPKDSKGGNLLIENKSDEPLTVKMPSGFVGVHVFKQIGGMGGMGMGGGMGGMGGGMGGMGGGMGGGQMMGGGMGGGMGGMGGGMGGMGGGMGGMGGGGFFSIPPETVARVPYCSVCLEHGKAEPSPRMNYEIRPVDEVVENETLEALINLVGTGRLDEDVAQAAAWHLTDEMSWTELATLKHEHVGGRAPTAVFSRQTLFAAQSLVSVAAAEGRKIAETRSGRGSDTKNVSVETEPEKPVRSRIR